MDAPSPLRRVARAAAVVVVVVYFAVGAILWGWQELMIFPAPTVESSMLAAVAKDVGAETFTVRAEDGVAIYGWHRRAAGERAVIFFHGNAESVADRVPLQDWLVDRGWDVVVIAYRGYPGSEMVIPSEEGLGRDARAAWAYTLGLGIPKQNIVLHGKSLGGGVAAMLAAEVGPRALVLESTFTGILDVAQGKYYIYPAGVLLRHPFLTRERAPRIHCPVLVMHADRDQTIPVEHGRALATMFEHVQYVEVAGLGHGETLPLVDPAARAAYAAFLDAAK